MGKFAESKKRLEFWKETDTEIELDDADLKRLDTLYNAAQEFIRVIMENPDEEYDQYYAGEIVEHAVTFLMEKGKPIYYPGITTDETGNQKLEKYYQPENVTIVHF